jgi:GNAT superfamily N-acetyltransferase
VSIEVWERERAADLEQLCAAALPSDDLSADELLACCWDGAAASVVLGADDGTGAIAACAHDHGPRRVGFVQLVAVHPDVRRQGRGRALLDAAHDWLFAEAGALEVRAGAGAPHYLWPGVDVTHLEALCLFESAGYLVTGGEVNMRCTTAFRADPPAGVSLRRAVDDEVVDAVLALVRTSWPWWEAEVARAVEHGCCHAAVDTGGAALGFACHSVNRAGWVGPMGTDPRRQHGGVGAALLAQVCRDLGTAEFAEAEIAWVGPVGFYAKAAGATISRAFRSLTFPGPT